MGEAQSADPIDGEAMNQRSLSVITSTRTRVGARHGPLPGTELTAGACLSQISRGYLPVPNHHAGPSREPCADQSHACPELRFQTASQPDFERVERGFEVKLQLKLGASRPSRLRLRATRSKTRTTPCSARGRPVYIKQQLDAFITCYQMTIPRGYPLRGTRLS